MERKKYISPKIEVFIMEFEGQICTSTQDPRFDSMPVLTGGESEGDPD